VDVVVIGAGPFGLSLAAHLGEMGVRHRVIGKPLDSWVNHMPEGMFLKSDGFASNLFDPHGGSTLKSFCLNAGEVYDDRAVPVPLDLFNRYADAFQKRHVPALEDGLVTQLSRENGRFALELDTGEILAADRVVIAIGITNFAYLPEELRALPPTHVSHGFAHRDMRRFAGRKVTVMGAGASAADIAAALRRADADVQMVARSPKMRFHTPPSAAPRPITKRLRHPSSGIGPGLRSSAYERFPGAFRLLPESVRHKIVKHHLGPAPGWHVREQIVGKVPVHLETTLCDARLDGDRLLLCVAGADGAKQEFVTDHLIAATGFRPELGRIPFLNAELRREIVASADTPRLSRDFESSVPGLYFTGPIAANSFGPLMRFMVGAGFAAQRISAAVAR
jgi:cation diffusion facilitator CzcD-associated flavoprotein CzcO